MKRLAILALIVTGACRPMDAGAPVADVEGPALADAGAPVVGQDRPSRYRLIDGDTFEVLADGEVIRIENIDAPESAPRAKCMAEVRLAALAKDELGDVMGLTWVQGLVIERHGKDPYGRTLAAVKLTDGTDVGEEMVRRGFAEPWTGRRVVWCAE